MKKTLTKFIAILVTLYFLPISISAMEDNGVTYETYLIFDKIESGENIVYEDNEYKVSVEVIGYKPIEKNDITTKQISNNWLYDQGTGTWSGIPPAGTYDLKISKSNKGANIYTASYVVNCTMNSGDANAIHYVYAPALDGPVYTIEYTQFEVLKSKPTNAGPAAAVLAWSADFNQAGYQVYKLNGYLKFEMNGDQYRLVWKI